MVAMTSNLKIENLHVEGNTLCLKFYPLGCCVSNLVEIRLLKKFSTLYLKDVFIFTKVVIMLWSIGSFCFDPSVYTDSTF